MFYCYARVNFFLHLIITMLKSETTAVASHHHSTFIHHWSECFSWLFFTHVYKYATDNLFTKLKQSLLFPWSCFLFVMFLASHDAISSYSNSFHLLRLGAPVKLDTNITSHPQNLITRTKPNSCTKQIISPPKFV